MPFSLSEFTVAASSDVAKIAADVPGSFWDRVYRALVERDIVARTPRGRLVQAGAVVVIGAALEQQFGPGRFSQFLRQVVAKSHGDLAKRIIVNGGAPATALRRKE